MSGPSSSSTSESFPKFFERWLGEQTKLLDELFAAESSSHDEEIPDDELKALINRVIEHYECYYRAKSKWAKQDVLAVLSPPWMSSLEEAFLWIGGWRPSMAFHLLYSKSGLQFEARLMELIEGLKTCDLGDLSVSQITQLDELQRKTIVEERDVTEMMAKHQETVADASMVELSRVVSEMMRKKEEREGGEGGERKREIEERVEETLGMKENGLEEILKKADELRMRTLKGIVDVLSAKQSVHFLIAAAELHLRLHEWGMKKDATKEEKKKKKQEQQVQEESVFVAETETETETETHDDHHHSSSSSR